MVDNNNIGTSGGSSNIIRYMHDGSSSSDHQGIEQDQRLLPIANVGRIMKQILPPNAKISKEAKETMQECVSEFISFVTDEASDKCRKERRKTVNGDDVCWALATLGFDDYSGPLRRYLHRFKELEGDRPNQEKARTSSSSSNPRHGMINLMNDNNNHPLMLETRRRFDENDNGTQV